MDTIRIKEEIPFEQEDEVEIENVRIKDELETGQEGEEEDCNTIYIKVEEPCENEERDNYTQKAETSEDPLLLNDGPVTSNKESHSSISYREQETGEAYNASVHVHQHTLYVVDQDPSHSAIKQENKLLIKKCEFCEKRFTLECNLNDHINTHTEEEPYLCEVCQKYFKQDGFKKRTDNREKPFQCELCEKCFKEKTGLNYHMGTHTGEKPFQCKFCEKCFLGRTNLITHIGTHTGDKPFQCKFCEKCFSMKRNLKIHIRTHSGEKPFQCEFCEKCFRQKNGLNYHMGTHTGVKPFQCEFCSKCFMSKNALKKHNVSHWREAIPM